MPISIREGLTQQHVLSALADLDAGISHPFGLPTGYELVLEQANSPWSGVVGI